MIVKLQVLSVLAVAALAPGLAWADQPELAVRHAALRLVVLAEPRSDMSVTVGPGGRGRLPPLSVRREGDRIIVDGGLQRPFGGDTVSCNGGPRLQDHTVSVNGEGPIAYADLPVVTVHAPQDVRVDAGGAVFATIAPARSVRISVSGCGDWGLGAVNGLLAVSSAGSADIHGADVEALQADLHGSGDVSLRRISGPLNLKSAGSADVRAAVVEGPVDASLSGSGDLTVNRVTGTARVQEAGSPDVRLRDGRISFLQVEVDGSGSFTFGGQAGQVQAAASGSGDIRIAHASGPVSRAASGAADIEIGR